MSYQCDECGAYLDPGEHCDCMEERELKIREVMNMLLMAEDGQYVLNVGG